MAERLGAVGERALAHRRQQVVGLLGEEVEHPLDRPRLARRGRPLDRERGEAVEEARRDREVDQLAESALADDAGPVELALEDVEDAWLLRESAGPLPGLLGPDLRGDPLVLRVGDRGLQRLLETVAERVPILEVELGGVLGARERDQLHRRQRRWLSRSGSRASHRRCGRCRRLRART